MDLVNAIEREYISDNVPSFGPGDTVRVHVKVKEGERERIQIFEGVVIKRVGGGVNENFTVRKMSQNVGVERTFPLHSPGIAQIDVIRRGKVRRSRLFYMRDRVGRATRIREKR